jgi:hypothetical protein
LGFSPAPAPAPAPDAPALFEFGLSGAAGAIYSTRFIIFISCRGIGFFFETDFILYLLPRYRLFLRIRFLVYELAGMIPFPRVDACFFFQGKE